MNVKASDKIADAIRLVFVEQLYTNKNGMLANIASQIAAAILVFQATRDMVFLYACVALMALWCARMLGMAWFDFRNIEINNDKQAGYWEMQYQLGEFLVMLLLGSITAYAFAFSDSTFAKIAWVFVAISSLTISVGRNIASSLSIDLLILAISVPVTVGLVLAADSNYTMLALITLPLIFSARLMAMGVQRFIRKIAMAHHDSAEMADRYCDAMKNMSHGLIMIAEDGRIAATSNRARSLLFLPHDLDVVGKGLDDVLSLVVSSQSFSHDDAHQINTLLNSIEPGQSQKKHLKLSSDIWWELSARRQDDGILVVLFDDVTEKVLSNQEMVDRARLDVITGLANRSWFLEQCEALIKNAKPDQKVCFAIYDMIDFRNINDTSGHRVGDKILKHVASCLKKKCPPGTLIARFGGDEFVIFFFAHDDNQIKLDLDHLDDGLSELFEIEGKEFRLNFNGGMVIEDAAHARVSTMQVCADIALQDAIGQDKMGGMRQYSEAMCEQHARKRLLKTELPLALERDDLTICYQPMFTPDGHRIAGAEALSRWEHTKFGPISPVDFVSIAEDIGIVREITKFVIRNATRDCASWPENMFVSVNLSAHDLTDGQIVKVISQALRFSGLHPSRLHLEITESALVDDPGKAATILRELRQMGMSVALDDFGTGYSSLSYLDTLPLNKVKVDRSFVKDIVDDERKVKLLRGIVNMSRELGLEIVVEGVETTSQLALVCDNNCADLIQGYVFGMPVPRSAFVELSRQVERRSLDLVKTYKTA